MINCYNLLLPTCWACSDQYYNGECEVALYKQLFSLSDNSDIKTDIVKFLKRDTLPNTTLYMRKAIELYYPQWLELFDKLSLII